VFALKNVKILSAWLVLCVMPSQLFSAEKNEKASAPIQAGPSAKAFKDPEPSKTPPSKDRYHLFHPTPKDQMREMSTDRPDKTESAYTVDAGHFQIEMDMLSFTYDRRNPENERRRVENYAIAPINFKMGLTNRIDLQFVFETYNINRERTRESVEFDEPDANGLPIEPYPVKIVKTRKGFGDITARLKINAWGNDGGMTALAFMPYVKIPTNQDGLGNDSVEGGLIVPLAVALPHDWDMGVMTQIDAVRNEDNKRYHAEFVNSITFGHDIVGKLGGYVEFWSMVSTEKNAKWVGSVDMGLSYSFTDNIKLDWGVNVGVTRSADDINPFIGLSMRF